jgi:MFS transporter, ACS family, hexuronate transporter
MTVGPSEPQVGVDDELEGGHGSRPKGAHGWAWGLCWLMFASTVLNYMDRQAVSLVAPQIQEEYHLRNVDFGWVLAAFSLTYAVCQVPSGYLADRWNVRWTYAGAVAWWSAAGMATAFSPSLGVLLTLRALLGVGESFNWPCALRVTRTVLPPADRSLGNGIFNSGAAVGAVLTPLVVPLLAARYGWRAPFLAIGGLGFFWVAAWLVFLGGPRRDVLRGRPASAKPGGSDPLSAAARRGLSGAARAAFVGVFAASGLVAATAARYGPSAIWCGIALLMIGLLVAARLLPPPALEGADWAASLGAVVRLRRFWVLVLVSVSINVCWHFLISWVPSFLYKDRELTALVGFVRRALDSLHFRGDPRYLASGLLTVVPFLMADAGNIGGGALSRRLAGRGMPPVRARMRVMGLCTVLISAGAFVGWIRSDTLVVLLLGAMAMGTAAFMANYFAFTQEVSARHTGLVVGILGGLGNLYAAGFHPLAGSIKDSVGSFAPIFVLVGLLPFVGLAALWLGWGDGEGEADLEEEVAGGKAG